MDKAPHCSQGHWEVVTIGSRFFKDTERCLAPVESEALGMFFGLSSAKRYCLGNPKLWVGVDHQTLVTIMGRKNIGPDITS